MHLTSVRFLDLALDLVMVFVLCFGPGLSFGLVFVFFVFSSRFGLSFGGIYCLGFGLCFCLSWIFVIFLVWFGFNFVFRFLNVLYDLLALFLILFLFLSYPLSCSMI